MRIGHPDTDPPMEASKWLKLQALIDEQEMAALFEELGNFEIYLSGVLTRTGEERVPQEEFLKRYGSYVNALKAGKVPDEVYYRSFFNAIFTVTSDVLYAIPLQEGKSLVRPAKPVVQLQGHSIDYSVHDGKFRSMVFGLDSILWGIQFSYPQICLDSRTKEVLSVDATFPNTALFKKLQQWMRQNTIPTPFIVGEQRVNVPMRLGKLCLEWIHFHPQLHLKNIKIYS